MNSLQVDVANISLPVDYSTLFLWPSEIARGDSKLGSNIYLGLQKPISWEHFMFNEDVEKIKELG